jgi:hypothetical protein
MKIVGPGNGESVLTKKRKAAKASAIETETKTAKVEAKTETVTVAGFKIDLATSNATDLQHLTIEIALEGLLLKVNGDDARRVQALLDMVRDAYRLQFVLKA